MRASGLAHERPVVVDNHEEHGCQAGGGDEGSGEHEGYKGGMDAPLAAGANGAQAPGRCHEAACQQADEDPHAQADHAQALAGG